VNGTDKFVFDTNAILVSLKGKQIPSSLNVRLGCGRWFASVITRIELFAFSGLAAQDAVASAEETEIRQFLRKCRVIPLNKKVERETILLRRAKPKLRLPDSSNRRFAIAATAVALNATLITNDTDILRLDVPGLKVVNIG
jgi:predicted nucleic acid-binding protein